jgi:allophanate hydrolase subunit 2
MRVAALVGSALFQDAGRGHVEAGVPGSGAFDRYAFEAGAALLGGDGRDAALEVVGTIGVVADVGVACALTGGDGAAATLDGWPVPTWTAFEIRPGQELEFRAGACGYLSVAGGFQADPVLGSRSTCLLGPLGPPPVRSGDVVALAPRCTSDTVGDFVRPVTRGGPVRVIPGPHRAMAAARVRVLDTSRIGIRVAPTVRSAGTRPGPTPVGGAALSGAAPSGGAALSGAAPSGGAALSGAAPSGGAALSGAATLPSLPVLPGAIQVLPTGEWVVLGPDSGTMGGYPIVGVVATADLDRWAHAQVGEELDLVPISADAPAPATSVPMVVHAGRIPG